MDTKIINKIQREKIICDFCQKTLCGKWNLVRHMQTFHILPEEKTVKQSDRRNKSVKLQTEEPSTPEQALQVR